MQISNPTNINSYQVTDHLYRKENLEQKASLGGNSVLEKNILEDEFILKDKFIQETHSTTLTPIERASLHALFGSGKPSELTLYGKNQLQHIHKGQFLDIKG